ncbi:MAG: hypothetical protein JOS17DRAFT_751740 [Linnemannia elongata]|nr:MAG: hypothetical protein JOS17DRAFT_751740 [Linnemannia elongata]
MRSRHILRSSARVWPLFFFRSCSAEFNLIQTNQATPDPFTIKPCTFAFQPTCLSLCLALPFFFFSISPSLFLLGLFLFLFQGSLAYILTMLMHEHTLLHGLCMLQMPLLVLSGLKDTIETIERRKHGKEVNERVIRDQLTSETFVDLPCTKPPPFLSFTVHRWSWSSTFLQIL